MMKSKRPRKDSKNSMKEHKTQRFNKHLELEAVSQSISSNKSRTHWMNSGKNVRS